MTVALVILGVVALALLGACVWLALQLPGARAASARAEADARSAISAKEEAERRLQTLDSELRSLRDEYAQRRDEAARLGERLAQLEDRRLAEDKRRAEQEQQFKDAFERLSNQALDASSKRLIELAGQAFGKQQEQARAEFDQRRKSVEDLVKPITETLKRTDEKLQAIEQQRTSAYAGLREQVEAMTHQHHHLREETGRLVRALSKPQVRGRYGEIQLQRIAEIAGMREYCDFDTQSTYTDEEGARQRPDMVVHLPNGRCIAIDAKTNTDQYLAALDAPSPDEAEQHLKNFARHVADQAAALGKKQYWANFDSSPEFVVMFIPGDQLVDAALEREPRLLESAAERGVIIASPATLIGLLRAVHVGWREKRLGESAEELFQLGRELHERASVALGHVDDLGKAIHRAMKKYNDVVGSVDMRLMPTLRRFEEAGAKSARELPELDQVEVEVRTMNALPAGATPVAPDGDAGDD
ncbi:MAG: DNA recombination protein RmuC [Phycisphaerales bacterium]